MKIATLTMNPSVDVFATVEQVDPMHKLRCRSPRRDPGGGGINVARAVCALGGRATALFPAGGASGTLLQQLLTAEEVEFRVHETAALSRESFTVQEEKTGREYRFILPGPELQENDWQACLEMLSALTPVPEYLVASGSLPPGVPDEFYARVARWARESGVRLVLDTSGPPLHAALEEGVYLVKPNRKELAEMAGHELAEHRDQEAACRALIEKGGSEVVALTLGKDGALLSWQGGTRRVEVPEVEMKSTVGAGDSFVAGMVLGLVRGMSLQEAFCLGCAAGTAALLTAGTELCRRKDVDRLYRQMCAG